MIRALIARVRACDVRTRETFLRVNRDPDRHAAHNRGDAEHDLRAEGAVQRDGGRAGTGAAGGIDKGEGDLLGSGTISGPEKNQRGSLLEISWNGTEPVELPGGIKRSFLEDGDSLVMRGWCQGEGYRVGFGEVEGTILAAE